MMPALSMPPMNSRFPLQERITEIRQKEFITIEECAVLIGVSEKTIRRRLPHLDRTIRDGRIVRIHRPSAMRYFFKW